MEQAKEPLFTTLLAGRWAQEAQTPKPTVAGTMMRYSGAHGCGRKMGYAWFEAEYSDPPTPAMVVQAGVGTEIGRLQAEAQIAAFGGEAEKPSRIGEDGWISGSADWFCATTPLGTIVYEHKVKSSLAFNRALGYRRAFGKASLTGDGRPPADAVTQVGLNVMGIERTYGITVDAAVVGVFTTDVLSVREARQVKVSDWARYCGEWVLSVDEVRTRAASELNRMEAFVEAMEVGYLPQRFAADDDGTRRALDPEGNNWQCDYCPYRQLCALDGDGLVAVLASKMTRRSTDTGE